MKENFYFTLQIIKHPGSFLIKGQNIFGSGSFINFKVLLLKNCCNKILLTFENVVRYSVLDSTVDFNPDWFRIYIHH